MTDALLAVDKLSKRYPLPRGALAMLLRQKPQVLRAVEGVSFTLRRGETLGLIGESGCGKSTLARTVLRLHEPDGGRITFDGTEVTTLPRDAMTALRRRMQIIFQDPYASLNPRKSVGEIVARPLRIHDVAKGKRARDQAAAMLEQVGLRTAHLDRFPHQFSGGQRQRIGIARALILNPDFVVCDEPVSALDVSIQAQVIALLRRLKAERGLTYLFISHDISVVGHMSDRIAVMYLGSLVETGPTRALLARPRHPYTAALLAAVPRLDGGGEKRLRAAGDLPSPLNPPPGCKYHTRCPIAVERCRHEIPLLRDLGEGVSAACHLA
jgi:oligopeptide/dipeptide ABC transporter ATP-binding protein